MTGTPSGSFSHANNVDNLDSQGWIYGLYYPDHQVSYTAENCITSFDDYGAEIGTIRVDIDMGTLSNGNFIKHNCTAPIEDRHSPPPSPLLPRTLSPPPPNTSPPPPNLYTSVSKSVLAFGPTGSDFHLDCTLRIEAAAANPLSQSGCRVVMAPPRRTIYNHD